MRSSRSNNVDEISPVEFRKLCDLLETIFAQTVSREVYKLFEERCSLQADVTRKNVCRQTSKLGFRPIA